MTVCYSELRCKEVICLNDGRRLGFVSDLSIKSPEGDVLSVTVPGKCRYFGLFGRKDDYCIPWGCIRRIGPAIILVDIKPTECLVPRAKIGLF